MACAASSIGYSTRRHVAVHVEVEQEPCGARVAVARLADAAGVDEPAPFGQVELGAGRGVSPDVVPPPSRQNQSATCEWPTAATRASMTSMQASASQVESTYSQTGSRGLAW